MGASLTLSGATTVAGFLALIPGSLPAVAQFAALSSLGVGFSVLLTPVTSAPGTLAFRRGEGTDALVCMVNCGSRAAKVPDVAGELLMTSGADLAEGSGGVRRLPPDTAAWFRPAWFRPA